MGCLEFFCRLLTDLQSWRNRHYPVQVVPVTTTTATATATATAVRQLDPLRSIAVITVIVN